MEGLLTFLVSNSLAVGISGIVLGIVIALTTVGVQGDSVEKSDGTTTTPKGIWVGMSVAIAGIAIICTPMFSGGA